MTRYPACPAQHSAIAPLLPSTAPLPLVAAVVMVLILGCMAPADAQSGVEPGAPTGPLYAVRLDDGSVIAGHQLRMSPDAVQLIVERQVRDIPMTTVQSIAREGDSLKNGAIVGAAVLGGLCALACAQGVVDSDQYAGVVAINTAYGALIGLFIDWRIHGTTTVYRAPATRNRSALAGITPTLSPGRSGLAFRWRW